MDKMRNKAGSGEASWSLSSSCSADAEEEAKSLLKTRQPMSAREEGNGLLKKGSVLLGSDRAQLCA
jgi:hypothetical protein